MTGDFYPVILDDHINMIMKVVCDNIRYLTY